MSATASNDLRYRMAQNFKQKIALSLNDTSDYNTIFDDLGKRKPAHRFGRGLVNLGEEIYELQIAKICEPEEYNVFIKDEIDKLKEKSKSIAENIPILPDIVKLKELKGEMNDLSKVIIGLRRRDIKPEVYDFENNLITIISAKNIEEAIQFTSNIWDQLEKIKDINTIILDPGRKVLSGKNEFADNYKKITAKGKEKLSKHNVCIIYELNKFINYIEEKAREEDEDDLEGAEILGNIIKKCAKKNFSFIIVDSADKLKEHNYDDWYEKNVNENNIIWVGNGIEDQYLLETNASRKEISNNCGCTFGYVNKKDKTIMIKLLEMKEKRDEDE